MRLVDESAPAIFPAGRSLCNEFIIAVRAITFGNEDRVGSVAPASKTRRERKRAARVGASSEDVIKRDIDAQLIFFLRASFSSRFAG